MVDQEAAVPLVVKYFPALLVCDGKASTTPQEAAEPSVVKYFPVFPVCEGSASTADQASPVAVEESAFK